MLIGKPFSIALNCSSCSIYYKHIGVYGYKPDFLNTFAKLKPSYLEKMEQLEQLRAIENGFPIKIV
ncbi:cytidylyltransferase domain-containing protein, partial [Acinetobacter soli]